MFHSIVASLYRASYAPATVRVAVLTVVAMSCVGCDGFTAAAVEFTQDDIKPIGAVNTIEVQGRTISSLPFDSPAVDKQQAELGRLLFWDPVLSGDQDIACASCHLPEFAYTDGQPRSIGVGGAGKGHNRVVGHTGSVQRNAQTVLNTGWNGINEVGVFDPSTAPMFWDNRTLSLVAQALEPIESRQEMRGDRIAVEDIHREIENRLINIPAYTVAFGEAFGTPVVSIDQVVQAMAAFQLTLVANNAPFDRWMRGEADAMTAGQVSGMQEFVIAGCADCHSGPLFSDFETHILGVQEGTGVQEPDSGEGNFAFRTPTLRQLDFTAPYFHAGQFSTLASAIDFYDEPRRSSNPDVATASLDPELLEVPEMDGGRAGVIISFLKALNDENFDQRVPLSVPSGLPPGGFEATSE